MTEAALLARLDGCELFPGSGRVTRVTSGEIEASGPAAIVGAHCEIGSAPHKPLPRTALRAQVVAVSESAVRLVPFGTVEGVGIGDPVTVVPSGAGVGTALAGRAVDALGQPLDGGLAVAVAAYRSRLPQILDRVSPAVALATGIRAIDGLLTLGRGQRIGVFAASGVGKTRLVEQLVRQVDCARVVVCQVGERGREVESLWRDIAAAGRRERATLVAATSDESAPLRVQAVETALSQAEYWRDAGEHVLLIVDSITRFAMALREIGLAAGEPPTVRAYTPNVLRELPRVVERCGAVRGGGSITAVFTVLSENDEVDDPIVEVMKSLLDGHVVLSRRLAQAGHFPAIDVGKSISRLFDRLVGEDHVAAARVVRAHLARYDEARILIESGMYKSGGDPELDAAVTARGALAEFLRQPSDACEDMAATRQVLLRLAGRSA